MQAHDRGDGDINPKGYIRIERKMGKKFLAHISRFRGARACVFLSVWLIASLIFFAVRERADFLDAIVFFVIIGIFAVMFLLFSVCLMIYCYSFKLTITDEEITIKGAFKYVKKYAIADIDKILYRRGRLITMTFSHLLIVGKGEEKNVEKRRELKRIDYNQDILNAIKEVWQGEIENHNDTSK